MKESDGSRVETDVTTAELREGGERAGLAAGFVAAACFGLLAAASGFAYVAFDYLAFLRSLSKDFDNQSRFRVLCSAIDELAPTLSWATAAAGAWLAMLAIAGAIVESTAPLVASEGQVDASSLRAWRARRVSAALASFVTCAVAVVACVVLERGSRWSDWATLGTVALGCLFGAIRAQAGTRTPRLPQALVPLTLTASSFQFGAADVIMRWDFLGGVFQYNMAEPLSQADVRLARANQPVGLLALLGPVLVLLTFAVWRWAEGARPSAGARSRAPHVLAVVFGVLALSYAGLDRRVRADLGKSTGGSGSNEDLLAYVQVGHPYIPPPVPTW